MFMLLILLSCQKGTKIIVYKIETNPFSSDPQNYDYFIHHSIYRSVLGTLVSNYNSTEVKGVLAESWKNSENDKVWEFSLRENLYFSNGDKITSEIIIQSLKRIFLLLKRNGSKGDFFNYLNGIEKLNDLDDEIEGLRLKQGKILFVFKRSMPDFLEKISFGLYSIVHPSNYDKDSLEWQSELNVVSSYTYKIEKINSQNFELGLNEHFNLELGPENKFEKVIISWDEDIKPDIYEGNSLEDNKKKKEFSFSGGVESGISFIRCHSWDVDGSICSKLEDRMMLRNSLLNFLKNNGHNITTSFFPKGMKGLDQQEFPVEEHEINEGLLNYKLATRNFSNKKTKLWNSIESFFTKFTNRENKNDISMRVFFEEMDSEKRTADFIGIDTGILIDRPIDDVKFMINSTAGIRIPDMNGKLKKLASEEEVDVNQINKEIWDQAIIWPIAHFTSGLFSKSFVDLNKLNLIQPPIDFTWVGKK
tara:strand:- start:7168 stop:8595 length:1428 start_codon:yes stop_codon:yes gene_type:complete